VQVEREGVGWLVILSVCLLEFVGVEMEVCLSVMILRQNLPQFHHNFPNPHQAKTALLLHPTPSPQLLALLSELP
jgi:hypothetical protein